ncbi:hypothetical protein DEAC_c31160 [Desulfosporosinus acididurans]|uniref:Uncharacterized protein n=1 Tax=Desulfosporosinus acididurans TaxID=476652 RepID=A0A0J1FNS8_9FIRM|nr:hypothetical protein [Desulfosporosinus acididurans]KLU65149.1 hypothetical protein DEAC_c31160 [Desulfosporosinus acididurans]
MKKLVVILVMGILVLTGCSGENSSSTNPSTVKVETKTEQPLNSPSEQSAVTSRSQVTSTQPKSAPPTPQPQVTLQTQEPQQISFKTYTNARFGFSIEYPNTFITKQLPFNNDGIILQSPDDSAELTVSGINNVMNETVTSLYNQTLSEHSNASYKQKGSDWFTISWLEGNQIAYQKSVVGSGSINTFLIKYPLSQKAAYNPIINRLNSSFKTPSIEQSHGVAGE